MPTKTKTMRIQLANGTFDISLELQVPEEGVTQVQQAFRRFARDLSGSGCGLRVHSYVQITDPLTRNVGRHATLEDLELFKAYRGLLSRSKRFSSTPGDAMKAVGNAFDAAAQGEAHGPVLTDYR